MHASKMSTHVKIFKKKINTTAEKISNCNYYNSVFILVRKFAVLAKQVLYHNNVFKLSSHFTIEPHSRHRLQQDSCSLISGNIVSLLKGAAWGGGGGRTTQPSWQVFHTQNSRGNATFPLQSCFLIRQKLLHTSRYMH